MPADTILTLDEIADHRIDAFTGIEAPINIGLAGPRASEFRTVPSTPPYQFKLFEAPLFENPSSVIITPVISGVPLEEVGETVTPSATQFRIQYNQVGLSTVEFNSSQLGLQMKCEYKGLGSMEQKSVLAVKLSGITSISVASSNSPASSQAVADHIISTGDDAATQINSFIATLSAGLGGKITFFEGGYVVKSAINLESNITLQGMGGSTLFEKQFNGVAFDLAINSCVNTILDNFIINGRNDTYTGNVILGFIPGSSMFQNTYRNIIVDRSELSGFVDCENLISCISFDGDNHGFENCNKLVNCEAFGNSLSGYSGCHYISNSKGEDNTQNGFIACLFISNCYGKSNGLDGFDDCKNISHSRAELNTVRGFDVCVNVTNNSSISNVSDGFQGCRGCGFNISTGNGGAQYAGNVYADKSSTYPVADTPAGGFNS